MLEIDTSPANLPVSTALAVMMLIGVGEAVGLGASAADVDLGADASPDVPDLLAWLGVGRVPLLILLVVFPTVFGLLGLTIQKSRWTASPAAEPARAPMAFRSPARAISLRAR